MAKRPIFLALTIGDAALEGVRSVVIDRTLGKPARALITVLLPEPIPTSDLVGQPATVLLGREEVEQMLDGLVSEASMRLTELEGAFAVTLTVESRIGLLRHSVDHRTFIDMDVRAIVTAVLDEHGLLEDRQRWSLSESYENRSMTVQYEESALDFVSRLLEEEGITFVSSSDEDGELFEFFDKSSAQSPIEGDPGVAFERSAGLEAEADAFIVMNEGAKMTAGKVMLREYDFEKPALDLKGEAEAGAFTDLERYEAHVGPFDPTQLARWAKVRLEAEVGAQRRISLEGHCLRMTPGRVFELEDAPGDASGEYLVTAVRHSYALDAGGFVRTSVTAQPKDVPYRQPLETKSPIAWGHDTAFIVAPEGSEVETIHTDEHGRVKVRFRWDRSDRVADDASAWMRVAQLQTAGSQVLPRIGWEVVVEYLEGDPDRPIVTGRLYNGAVPPPYALPEGRTRTALQSASTPGGNGRNEIRLEDAKGKEEVAISAQKNQTINVANDSTESVAVNSKREIGANLTVTVGGDEKISINSGVKSGAASEDLTVGGSRELTVDAVMGIGASGAIETSIGGSLTAMIGSPLKGLLDLAGEVAAEVVEAKAKEAVTAIQEKAQGKVDQLLGSVGDLTSKATGLSDAANSSMGQALQAAGAMPNPSGMGEWASKALGVNDALGGLAEAAMSKVKEATGSDGAGGGGESQANEGGPDGAMPANAAADGACGPGHSILHALATLDESYGGSKITLAAGKVTTVVGAARTIDVGAARIELTAGDRVESSASKTESMIGRVILASGDIAEETSGSQETTVGGAILEKVGGNATVEAGASLKLAGALWKVDASSAIVLKCGGSTVTIAGGGIAISTPTLTLTAPTIKLPKSGTER